MVRDIKLGSEKLTVVGVYRRRGERREWRQLEEWIEREKDYNTGDFNTRTGELE